MSTKDAWLQSFFESRKLTGPDGRMLYSYRLSADEYQGLRTNLETWVASSSFNLLAQTDTAFCARFVLLASEWWHREYAGGAWRWEPIIEQVCGNSSIDISSRTACVEKGFAFWGHRPDNSRKRFLGAVVAHGGLPLRALGQGIGTVSRILRDGLRLTARYGWQEEQLISAIGERADGLPESLRKDDIYRLLATMILTAMDLRREFGLASSKDPISTLQAHDEKWMERFPISLEESAARPLLTDLLREAAAQSQLASTSVFSVRRSLVLTGHSTFNLQADLSPPQHTSAEHLAAAFRISDLERLPSYFSIDLSGDAEPWLEGRLLLGQENIVRLDGGSRTIRGPRALDDLSINLRKRATPISDGPCAIPGGAAIPTDQPLIFAERESAWVLVSVGGARLPEKTVCIALPNGWDLKHESAQIEKMGCLRIDGVEEMELLILSGSAVVSCNNESYCIRSGQSTRLTEVFSWEGKRLSRQPKRYVAFRGIPNLWRTSEDGSRTKIPSNQIVWKSAGSGDVPPNLSSS